jgi:hypothetical protein
MNVSSGKFTYGARSAAAAPDSKLGIALGRPGPNLNISSLRRVSAAAFRPATSEAHWLILGFPAMQSGLQTYH